VSAAAPPQAPDDAARAPPRAAATEVAIDLRGVHKAFGPTPVLIDVELCVTVGTRLGIIGPAAAGKSLLLKLLTGLMTADAGTISVLGDAIVGKSETALGPLRRRIGMLFQSYALFDFLTVAGNVAFPLEQRGEDSAEQIDLLVAQRLRAVGLAGTETQMPSQLSGGMKKRVGIARATIASPPLILYDEPTAGLDPVTSRKIFDLLDADQRRSGATVVAVSSDVASLLSFVDEIAFIRDGAIGYRGPVASLPEVDDPELRQFLDAAIPQSELRDLVMRPEHSGG
jgi:phospholipid/cholesterol/gamma-HCH transport system ATP-binding protein